LIKLNLRKIQIKSFHGLDDQGMTLDSANQASTIRFPVAFMAKKVTTAREKEFFSGLKKPTTLIAMNPVLGC